MNGVLLVSDTPFTGSGSYQLDKLLRRAGLEKDAFFIGTPESIAKCNPKVIVPMGENALRICTGEFKILRHRGRILQHSSRSWVLPTLHPRDLYPSRSRDFFGERNPQRFTGVVVWDLHKAIAIAREGFTRLPCSYECDPTPEQFAMFALSYEQTLATCPDTMLSWDIETPYKIRASDEGEFDEGERDKTILRISFAFRPGHATSVPWSGPYMPTIRRLLASKGVHVGWNVDGFDLPLVRDAGVEVLGEVQDFMWAFHLWQSDLPKGLEFVTSFFSDLLAWKHLNNADPALYSAIDADAALRNALGLKEVLKQGGQWDTFLRHVVKLDPILFEAGQRGSLIDKVKQAEMTRILSFEKARLIEAAQGMVPRELKPRKRFKKQPKAIEGRDFDEVEEWGWVKECVECHATIASKSEHQKGKGNPCKGKEVEKVRGMVKEWDEVLPWNPNSTEQIKSYIRHFDHPMGRDKMDRQKESANAQHLGRLATRFPATHPIYATTVEMHKVSKALGTYVIGFTPDENGLIHTTYDHTPSTWRLASKNVNLQNVGKRDNNKWVKDARKQIIARPGHVFVQADSSAIEAVFVGWFMGDGSYIALARKGVHAMLACARLDIPFTSENVKLVKAEHPTLYAQCKVIVHGTSYGMGTGLMVETNPDLFPTRAIAQEFQNLLFAAVPRLKSWQHEILVRANKETRLTNPWGFVHHFYQVFAQGSSGHVIPGDDAKRAVAFLPQSSAGAFMMDNLVEIGDTWLRQYLPAHMSVHDGYCVEVPENRKEEAIATLSLILTRPIPEMGGLRVGCEVEVGKNWGEMEFVKAFTIQEEL